jgi:hypothetical protein
MEMMLLLLVLAGGPDATAESKPSSAAVIAELQPRLQTGSLIFSQGDCLAVKIFSQSSYTHVGAVVVRNGDIQVYDSMNGSGVRASPLAEYLRLQTPCDLHVVHPSRSLTEKQAAAFEAHLKSQLGRKYAIKHHLSGQRGDGLHCAEYVTDSLMAASVIHANRPARVSPGSLLQGLEQGSLCVQGGRFRLKAVSPPPPANLTWCQRTWHDTVSCCSDCGSQLTRWFCCK